MLLFIIVWLEPTKDSAIDGVRDSAASLDSYTVRQQARGQWLGVLSQLAPELNAAIHRLGRHVPCPVHGGKDGFRLFRDAPETGGGICNTCGGFGDGFALLMWLHGWRFPAALRAVADAVGGGLSAPAARPFQPRTTQAKDAWRASAIERVWAETLAPDDPAAQPLQRYLTRRGLDHQALYLKTVRFHPYLGYWDQGRRIASYPALIARVTAATGELVTLHRTYLTNDGDKAPVDAPKKLMPYPRDRMLRGSAIRLAPSASKIGVAEGIETALAVQQMTTTPVWALGSASLLALWEPPEGVEHVTIWADRDRSRTGEQAARRLAKRLTDLGLHADIVLPDGPHGRIPQDKDSYDWCDALQAWAPSRD